ncbi:putative zinc finger CCCH domain-containing protein 51 [Miscanthus floridulus]|uniref:putative zinc finger CCCH domain-containing protein 51 n=1 Tax=Miscanthus floridulus TaxID=154761 RepID=UPI003459EFAB
MDIEECRRRLQDKVWLLHPTNAEGIVDYMIANIALEDIRSYLLTATNDTLLKLFEGANRLQKILDLSKENEEPLFGPFRPFDQIGPQKQYQFPSRSYSQVLQAPLHPIGPTGAFQKPYSKLIGFGDHSQSLSILDDTMPSHYQCASINVDGYPSNAKVQKPCRFYFSFGNCKYGENCRFSHVSGYPEINNMRQVHHLGSLQMLEMEIRDLLSLQTSSQVQGRHYVVLVKDAPMYFTHGFESVMPPAGSDSNKIYITFNHTSTFTHTDVQNYFSQYGAVSEVRLSEKERHIQGLHHVVLVKDAPKYFTHGFESVMPSASSDSNKIYITFNHTSTFTHTDVQNYFSQYGAVSEVRLSEQERRIMLAKKDVHFNCSIRAVSDVDAVGEHHTGDNEVELSHVPKGLDEA